MKKIWISFLIVVFIMSSASIYNLGYLTNSSFNPETVVYAKGSSSGFRSGGFSSGSSNRSYSSGSYSAPKSNTQPKTAIPPATGGSSAQTAPRTSFFPIFMPFGWGWGGGFGGFGMMYNPFAGIFQLIILAGIVFAVIWFIRRRNSK